MDRVGGSVCGRPRENGSSLATRTTGEPGGGGGIAAPQRATYAAGDVATSARISVRRLRLWDADGIAPASHRSDGGHRRYDRRARARVLFVAAMRRRGIPWRHVRHVLGLLDEGFDVPGEHGPTGIGAGGNGPAE